MYMDDILGWGEEKNIVHRSCQLTLLFGTGSGEYSYRGATAEKALDGDEVVFQYWQMAEREK